MLRWCAFAVGVCLSASSVARADTPANPASIEDKAKFNAFVEMAERARLAGRYDQAAFAYKAALDIQLHPVISGRLGLVLMKLGQLDRAAEELHEAVERGQGVPAQQRREVTEAYDKAKALTTWVHINISQLGAKVTYDGSPRNREGYSTFWMFAMPGEHTLRASLDGYEDAVATFTAKPGEEITVALKLEPLPLPELPELPPPAATSEARNFPPWLRSSNIADDPNYSPKEDPFYGEPKEPKPKEEKKGPRFSVSGGVVTVFGVASWNPAIGGVVGVGLRPHENFSIGLEGRAAWLTTGVGGGQISAMTAGGNLSACGHMRWFFGCGLGYIGTINVTPSSNSYEERTIARVQPGFGARLGGEFRLTSAFVVRGSVDVLNLARGMQLAVGGRLIVDQPPVLIAAQLGGGWEF